MESVTAYINSLSTDFEGVKNYFNDKNIRVLEDKHYYMLIPNETLCIDDTLREILWEHKGTILDKIDNSVVCRGFPEHNVFSIKSDAIYAQEYINGTLIRVFFNKYMNEWCMSTNGTLDAYRSYWICERSIGRLFDECLSRIYRKSTVLWASPLVEYLDCENCYQFMLVHPEVHLHRSIVRPSIFHIGTYSLLSRKYIETRVDQLPQPRKYLFHSFDELCNQDNLTRYFPSGKILYYPTTSASTQIGRTIVAPEEVWYNEKILGRNSNLYLRYLELNREADSAHRLHKAKEEYPIFHKIEYTMTKNLRALANDLSTRKEWFIDEINQIINPNAYDDEVYFELLYKVPTRLIMIALNCLGYIRTRDVDIPPSPKEEEFDEVEKAIDEKVAQDKFDALCEMFYMPHSAFTAMNETELYDFVAPKIHSVVQQEIEIENEETYNTITVDEVIHAILQHDALTIQRLLDDKYYLATMIQDCLEDLRQMNELEALM